MGVIRQATGLDKSSVLEFCKNTFSWGDYVRQVWDAWLAEGNLFLFEDGAPAGICHASYSKGQVWIEGIRVDPGFRRQKIASRLVTHAESVGRQKGLPLSYMLIDTENSPSLSMAGSLGYGMFQTWNFYALDSKPNPGSDVRFEQYPDAKPYPHYVSSWRWLPLDVPALRRLCREDRMVASGTGRECSLAVLSHSEHFDKTLIVTLFSHSDGATLQVLRFLQNYGQENDCERIQILAKEQLPGFDSLNHRISFCLMKKSLA